MRGKFRKIHWLVTFLVLGIAMGFIASCGGSSSDDDDTPELSVEAEWASAVDFDLQVLEPTGQTVWGDVNGPTAISLGDNMCGFGSTCDPSACTTLPCSSRERIYADTVQVGGRYTISVDSFSLNDENVAIFITVPSSWVQEGNAYYMRVDCTIPAGTTPTIAYADFPVRGSAVIGAEIATVTCAVTDQTFR